MRIGSAIIDTDIMKVEDLDILINELFVIRARKVKAAELLGRLNQLLADAKEDGFTFIDKDFGDVLIGTDFTVYDER